MTEETMNRLSEGARAALEGYCVFCGDTFVSTDVMKRQFSDMDEDGCDCHCVECARINIEMGFWKDPRAIRMEQQKLVNQIFSKR